MGEAVRRGRSRRLRRRTGGTGALLRGAAQLHDDPHDFRWTRQQVGDGEQTDKALEEFQNATAHAIDMLDEVERVMHEELEDLYASVAISCSPVHRFEKVEPGDEQILPDREQRELDAVPSFLALRVDEG